MKFYQDTATINQEDSQHADNIDDVEQYRADIEILQQASSANHEGCEGAAISVPRNANHQVRKTSFSFRFLSRMTYQ